MARAAGADAAASLLESLRKRGVEPLVVESDLWAMAHACVMGAGTLLVMCEPQRLTGAAQLALALRKYAPGVVVYAYEPGGAQVLRMVEDQDLVNWGAPERPAPEPRPAPARAIGKPHLRLTGDDAPRPIGPSLPITEHTSSASDVLSADELAMLLGRNGPKGFDGDGNAKGDQR
ncbi:MAG: hypothetical protein Q8L55_14295 [Phycisphaerales bacterium]|nr:hypothetical protein [Phycisphaerales bacterium]